MDRIVRIMPCLDMKDGRVVKGVHFLNLRDAGDPAACAKAYCEAGADELALLDICATVEGRETLLSVVRDVAAVATVPFTVGGGIHDVAGAMAVIEAGADKVSLGSAVFRKPWLIGQLIKTLGAERVTIAIDVDRSPELPSGYEVYVDGGRTATGMDALEWAKQVAGNGVRCILPTSKATDGAQTGYDLPLIRMIAENTPCEVVASGGAGRLEHFLEAAQAGAAVLLAASVFHFGIISMPDLKIYLDRHGIAVNL